MLKLGLGVNKPSGNVGDPPQPPALYTPTVFTVSEDSTNLQASVQFQINASVSPVSAGTYSNGTAFPTQATVTAKSGNTTLFYIEGVDFTVASVVQLSSTANLVLNSSSYDITGDVTMVAEEIPTGNITYEIEFFFSNNVNGVYLNTPGASLTLSYVLLSTDVDSDNNSVLVYDLGDVSITDSASPNTVSIDMQLQFQYDPAPPASGIGPVTLPIVCSLTAYQDVDGTEQQIFTKSFTSITFEETSIPSGPGFLNATLTVDVDNEATFGEFHILNKAIKYVFAIDTEATTIAYSPFETGEYEAVVELAQTNLVQQYPFTFSVENFGVIELSPPNNEDSVTLSLSLLIDFNGDTFNYTNQGESGLSLNATFRGKQVQESAEVTLFEFTGVNFGPSSVVSEELFKANFVKNFSFPGDLGEDGCLVSPQTNQPITYELEIQADQEVGDYVIELSDPANTSEVFTNEVNQTTLNYSCSVGPPASGIEVDSYWRHAIFRNSNIDTIDAFSLVPEQNSLFRQFTLGLSKLASDQLSPLNNYYIDNPELLLNDMNVRIRLRTARLIDGQQTNYDAYLINPNSYITLRDTVGSDTYGAYLFDATIPLDTAEFDNDIIIDELSFSYRLIVYVFQYQFAVPTLRVVLSQRSTLTQLPSYFGLAGSSSSMEIIQFGAGLTYNNT